jgi:urea transport system ATP-binding protein
MLQIDHIDVAHGRTQVLFGVSLVVPDDGLMAVMGRNGVGKSTLMNAIMGVLKCSAGTITFNGEEITRMKPYHRVRRGLAYVPQGRNCFPQLSVAENLAVVREGHGRPQAAVDEVLDQFPRLKPFLKRRAGFLSGGQQQQLAIARALLTKPKLLVLDEPTEGIQPSIIHEIEDTITTLSKLDGLSILLVEQYVEFALRLADSYAVLDGGRIAESGSASSVEGTHLRMLLSV